MTEEKHIKITTLKKEIKELEKVCQFDNFFEGNFIFNNMRLKEKVKEYNKRYFGYKPYCWVYIIDVQTRCLINKKLFIGNDPPRSVYKPYRHYHPRQRSGKLPKEEIINFIKSNY